MTDWQRWHAPYDDSTSALSARLSVVQEQVAKVLDRAPPGPLRLLSLCSGQGRDVLPVLARHPRGGDVTGRLVVVIHMVREIVPLSTGGRRDLAAAEGGAHDGAEPGTAGLSAPSERIE